jgi:uncharacterized C2H2 Zn-finger protein
MISEEFDKCPRCKKEIQRSKLMLHMNGCNRLAREEQDLINN